jgi:DNA-binding protein WhiA
MVVREARTMSFASETKKELCRLPLNKNCRTLAEAYGVLLYCNTFSNREIRIITENKDFISRLIPLFKKEFGLEFDIVPEEAETEGKKICEINDVAKISEIFDTLDLDIERDFAHHVNYGVIEDDCCRAAFIRGAFLAGGSVTDPEKGYHMEFVTNHYYVERETHSIYHELGFEPKSTSRNGNYISYFKNSETIEDLLTTMGAPLAAMEVMNAKVEKDVRNSINRRVNCDTANLSKMVNASIEQIHAIKKLYASGAYEKLSDKLKMTAELRLKNPQASLAELAEMCDPPVTKSCLNHRLRKLQALSGKLT